MIHILSSSTLFPYTTLFRSHRLVRAAYLAAFAVGGGAGNIETHLHGATTELVDGPTQSRLLRCIFGDPFRPLVHGLAPRTTALVSFARTIYEERTMDCLPILGDMLEEAGCTDTEMLNHCHQPRGHVRGCWVLDALLREAPTR